MIPMKGAKVFAIRQAMGLKQTELARLLGVHPITVSKWENDRCSVTPWHSALLKEFGEMAANHDIRRALPNMLLFYGVPYTLSQLLRDVFPNRRK